MGRKRGRPAEDAAAVETGVGLAAVRPDPRGGRALVLTIDGNVHGAFDPEDPAALALDYQARLVSLLEQLLPDGPTRLVHLGGGAFAVPRALAARRPAGSVAQLVVERSAAIIGLARDQLGLRDVDGLRVRKGDARAVLAKQPDASADLVVGDVFIGLDTPRHLATVEFMEEVVRVLSPRGRYVVNLVDEQPWSVLGAHAATAGAVFREVDAVGSRGVARLRDPGNVLLVAGHHRLDRNELGHRLATGATPSAFVGPGRLAELMARHRPRRDSDG